MFWLIGASAAWYGHNPRSCRRHSGARGLQLTRLPSGTRQYRQPPRSNRVTYRVMTALVWLPCLSAFRAFVGPWSLISIQAANLAPGSAVRWRAAPMLCGNVFDDEPRQPIED